MSYIKQNWQDGDIITAEKLNHMEDGIINAPGYTVSINGMKTLFEGDLEYSGEQPATAYTDINSPTLPAFPANVTFDGSMYENLNLKWTEVIGIGTYIPYIGADVSLDISSGVSYDWSEYPFCVVLSSSEVGVVTKELTEISSFSVSCQSAPQNVNFKFEYSDKEITIDSDFKQAVQQATDVIKVTGTIEEVEVTEENPLGLIVTFSNEAQKQIVSAVLRGLIPEIKLTILNRGTIISSEWKSFYDLHLFYTFNLDESSEYVMHLNIQSLDSVAVELKIVPTTPSAGIYLYVNTSQKPPQGSSSIPIDNCVYLDADYTELATSDKINSTILGYIRPSKTSGGATSINYVNPILDVTVDIFGSEKSISLYTDYVNGGWFFINIRPDGNSWSYGYPIN